MTLRLVLLASMAAGLLGCGSEPDGSVQAPTAAQMTSSIDRSLDSLEKTPPANRPMAHASLDDLLNAKGTPAQKERYAKLMAP